MDVLLGYAALTCGLIALALIYIDRVAPYSPLVPAAGPRRAVNPSAIFCERTKRWRDPVSRRFVKAPA